MPDVTVSFTDAQWTRVVLKLDEGTVDATKLAANWKAQVTDHVKSYEESLLAAEDF